MNTIVNTVNSFHYPMPPAAGPAGDDGHDPAQVVASSSVLGSEHFDVDAMTPDALLFYLSSRMGSIDDQMTTIFDRQKSSEKVRLELRAIQEDLTRLPTDTDEQKQLDLSSEISGDIQTHLANIAKLDEKLGARLSEHLSSDGQILNGDQSTFTTGELNATKDYLNLVGKDLESGSQMDMITLQSLMGARQTAIQLSTNLISALNESQKSVVGNIR